MRIYQQEIFGPVPSCERVANFTATAQLINDHVFNNGMSCPTRDGNVVREFTRCSKMDINAPIPVSMAWHDFKGRKNSLFGDMHAYSEKGMRFFYNKQKSTLQHWPKGIGKGAEFVIATAK